METPRTQRPLATIGTLTQELRAKAQELGFEKVGFSRAEKLDERNGLQEWLNRGNQGEMQWMGKNRGMRIDPLKVLSKAKSVISLAMNYYSPFHHSEDPRVGRISRYAWGCDYHQVLKDRVKMLAAWIAEREPEAEGLYYADTGPVMDKVWAHKSGLGWIGKHSNLITRERGSWVFLAEILSNLDFDYDQESRNYCGTCHRCIDVCPTKAIIAPYVVDSRLCISYLTIELRGAIPRELRPLIGSRIFGCDDCQDACPWNRFAQPSLEKDFYPREGNHTPVLVNLMKLTEAEFQVRFRNTALKRAKYRGFLRNVAVALGNSRDPDAIPVLVEALLHREALVREHAAWALGEIGGEESVEALKGAQHRETEPTVMEEIEDALRKQYAERDSCAG